MSKFTAGEWKYVQAFGVVYNEDTSAVIASVRGAGTGSCFCLTQEGQANARLIAAAPEMYRLLQNFCYPEEPFDARMAKKCDEVWELLKRIDGEEVITNG